MTGEVSVEATGETVGEARWAALRELERRVPGLDREFVRFEVLSEGQRGLLGVGYAPARVIAAVDAPAVARPRPPAEESPLAAHVRELVERATTAIGAPCRVEIAEDEDAVIVTCSGPELGRLIGRHGQTIDALQYLVNAAVFRGRFGERKEIVIDAAGYRERRLEALHALAVRSAERAVSTGARVDLEPMSSVERKLVHLRLQDYPGVRTASEGTEPNRYVVILPV